MLSKTNRKNAYKFYPIVSVVLIQKVYNTFTDRDTQLHEDRYHNLLKLIFYCLLFPFHIFAISFPLTFTYLLKHFHCTFTSEQHHSLFFLSIFHQHAMAWKTVKTAKSLLYWPIYVFIKNQLFKQKIENSCVAFGLKNLCAIWAQTNVKREWWDETRCDKVKGENENSFDPLTVYPLAIATHQISIFVWYG